MPLVAGFGGKAGRKTAMSNRHARVLAAGGAAILVAALGVTAASAATAGTTWTVRPGGGVQAMSSRLAVTDSTTRSTITCQSSTASGTLRSGSGLPGPDAGHLSAISFATCSYPVSNTLLLIFFVQPGGLPWHVNFSSYNTARGVVRGTVSDLAISVSDSTAGHGCSARIDGTSATADDGRVMFRYTDRTGRLTLLTTGSNLHFYDVSSGCFGIFNDGDPATLSATYTMTPKQAITSP
jgi:hypothetical protein